MRRAERADKGPGRRAERCGRPAGAPPLVWHVARAGRRERRVDADAADQWAGAPGTTQRRPSHPPPPPPPPLTHLALVYLAAVAMATGHGIIILAPLISGLVCGSWFMHGGLMSAQIATRAGRLAGMWADRRPADDPQ